MKKLFYLAAVVLFASQAITANAAVTMGNKLSGAILLQVESKGEAWYVNPGEEQRYYLGRPADAFSVMRKLGLGVSNKSFAQFEKTGVPKSLSGKILLKVEDKGKAYYVFPKNLKMYSLGKPEDAFGVMRELGIGISNSNLRSITVSQHSALPTVGQTPAPAPTPAPTPTPTPTPSPTQASVSPYVSSVVRVQCFTQNGQMTSAGSGTLVEGNYGDSYIKGVMTNLHVVAGGELCGIYSPELDQVFLLSDTGFQYSEGSDFIVIEIFEPSLLLNFTASQLPACPNDIAMATPLYIIGYPITTGMTKTITNGILSGQVAYNQGWPYLDYYVSAKIDAGNSGGLALAEYNHGFCMLGIPTALTQGEFENLGIIQNINNLQYEQ